MPFKQPIRDLSTVKCIKRSKDKSGEEKIEYVVLFDFVSFKSAYIQYLTPKFFKEDKQWDLTEEIVADLKEIFILFDTDTDGVLTIEQVYQAMNVMGMRRPGNILVCNNVWLR